MEDDEFQPQDDFLEDDYQDYPDSDEHEDYLEQEQEDYLEQEQEDYLEYGDEDQYEQDDGRDLSYKDPKDLSQLTQLEFNVVKDERDRYLSEKRSLEVKLKEVEFKLKVREDDLKDNQDEREKFSLETKLKALEVKVKVREDDLKDTQVQLFETKRQLKEIQQTNAQREKIDFEKIVQDQKEVIEMLKGEKEKLSDELIKSRNELKDKTDELLVEKNESNKRLEAMEKERAVLEERNKSFQAKNPLKMIEKCQNTETLLSTQLKDGHLSVLQTVVVDRISHKWRGIAIFLKFSISKMDYIEHDTGREKRDICLKMFSEWLKNAKETGSLPRTLQSVCEALKDRDEKQVADELVAAIQNA